MSTCSVRDVTRPQATGADAGILLEAGTNEVEILTFVVGSQRFGVNVAKVREARVLERRTFLPCCPVSMDGVVRIRDSVVPAVDLAHFLWGTPPDGDNTSERHLLLEFNNQMIAFRVQGIDRVHRVSWKNIIPLPGCFSDTVPVTGLLLLDGKIVTLLDFESIGARLGISGNIAVTEELAAPPKAVQQRLVFADDSALIRRMMLDALKQAGYQDITVFCDGQEAWDYLSEAASQNTTDTIRSCVAGIITDVEMPRMDGFSLTRHIRENPVLKDIPVILFSSLVSKDSEKKGKQVGATAQISKPKWGELAATLLEVVGQLV
jgi:two-component system, chemotaxis family, chemotaxis protein CheV